MGRAGMDKSQLISGLQLAILREIWSRGEATVAEVHNALQRERGLAMTTVATVLSRLEKRRLITHRREGRQFVYRARVSEEDVRSQMVAEITERLFHGDVTELVSHLVADGDISQGDLARVRELIETRESELGAGAPPPAPDEPREHPEEG